MGTVRYAVTAVVVAYVTFAFFRYLDTHVPEGVPEVWNARILDASLRTTGSVVSICSLSSLPPPPSTFTPPPPPHALVLSLATPVDLYVLCLCEKYLESQAFFRAIKRPTCHALILGIKLV